MWLTCVGVVSVECREQITTLLTDLGCTQADVCIRVLTPVCVHTCVRTCVCMLACVCVVVCMFLN